MHIKNFCGVTISHSINYLSQLIEKDSQNTTLLWELQLSLVSGIKITYTVIKIFQIIDVTIRYASLKMDLGISGRVSNGRVFSTSKLTQGIPDASIGFLICELVQREQRKFLMQLLLMMHFLFFIWKLDLQPSSFKTRQKG